MISSARRVLRSGSGLAPGRCGRRERPTTKSVCTKAPAGRRSAATSTSGYEPHTSTRSAAVVVRSDVVGQRGRVRDGDGTIRARTAGPRRSDCRDGHAGEHRPPGTPGPPGDDRHREQHQWREHLQPVVAEEPQPGCPRGQPRGNPQPQVDVVGERPPPDGGDGGDGADADGTTTTGWNTANPAARPVLVRAPAQMLVLANTKPGLLVTFHSQNLPSGA